MLLHNHIVAAFTGDGLDGNPAGICQLDEWLPDELMQAIAGHNGVPETAFFVDGGDTIDIRWFTPTTEANMCGHATLAAVWLLRNLKGRSDRVFRFRSAFRYDMSAKADDDFITLDFPAGRLSSSHCAAPVTALGIPVEETLVGQSWVCRLKDEAAVRGFVPDLKAIGALSEDGIIITAEGTQCDIVSRYFTPQSGIPEDPATGYAHTLLVPYWAERLRKLTLHARQLSERGGEIFCELKGNRVLMRGRARLERERRLEVDIAGNSVADV